MEIWNDLETGKYYVIGEKKTGNRESNRFGSALLKFSPYGSGFPHKLNGSPLPIENLYTVQPKRFDGYSQFPRPLIHPSNSNSSVNAKRKKKNLSTPESFANQPLKYLSVSVVHDQTISRIKLRKNNRISTRTIDQSSLSIEKLKASFMKETKKDLKTLKDLSRKLREDIEKSKPFCQKLFKNEEKIRLKGFFMNEYPTHGDLFEKEQKVLKITNPDYYEKLKKIEVLDRKNLERRRSNNLAKLS